MGWYGFTGEDDGMFPKYRWMQITVAISRTQILNTARYILVGIGNYDIIIQLIECYLIHGHQIAIVNNNKSIQKSNFM